MARRLEAPLVTVERFFTSDGVQVPAVTADQMREIDRIAIEETGPNLYQMMENAGRSLALVALERLEPAGSVIVMAGAGGNGGGGICAARHLANRGVDVSLATVHGDGLSGVPNQQLEVYRSTSGRVLTPERRVSTTPSLIIDALIGYSLSGAPRGGALELMEWANRTGSPILSLDVPSGLDATSGVAEGAHVTANWTLTLALPKTGLDAEAVGDLVLADIGIPAETYQRSGLAVSPEMFGSSFTVRLETS
jgi:NAD(P)H-hydrate epimerase